MEDMEDREDTEVTLASTHRHGDVQAGLEDVDGTLTGCLQMHGDGDFKVQ